jgi:serine/threonine protein kinase
MTEGVTTSKSPPDYPSLQLFSDLLRVDFEELDLNTANIILVNSKSNVYRYRTDFAVSIHRYSPEKEIEIMRFLSNISIPVVGYVVAVDGWLDGYIMPLAKRIPTDVSMVQKTRFMEEMISLVESSHKQGYIHGDIKLANFLSYDNKIYLCDFEEAQKIGEEKLPSSATMMYRPPWRVKADLEDEPTELPISTDDDFYGLGLSIWELFTGHRVYEDLDGIEAEGEHILNGEIVNVDEAGDVNAIETIWKYIEMGSRGVIRRQSPFYNVTGPPHESLTVSQYFKGLQRRLLAKGIHYEIPRLP